MSSRTVQGNNVPARTLKVAESFEWVRNPAWPALTAPTTAEQKVVGLYAVWPGDGVGNGGNFFAVNCAGNYTVDFGDGTSVNTATGVQTNYEYNFADVDLYDATVTFTDTGDLVNRTAHGYSDGARVQFYRIVTTTGLVEGQFYFVINATANTFQVAATVGGAAIALTTNGSGALLPYKIATVTITPQAAQNLTTVNINVRNSTAGLLRYASGWLQLAIAGSNITSLVIGAGTTQVSYIYLENINIVQLGAMTSFSLLFRSVGMQHITINVPSTLTNMTSAFYTCTSLKTVSLLNTAAVTSMNSMFHGCTSLKTVSLPNTAAVTSTNGMFQSCTSLATVPLFNTAAVTDMTSMFNACSSLQTVPLFNTAAVTSMNSMFSGCTSLVTVPLFNTAAVTSMASMFNGCGRLKTVPLFNTAAVTSMNSMFSGCTSLVTVPLFNTAAVTNMSSAFSGCTSLQTVSLPSTAAVTDMSYMFYTCSSLQTVSLLNTAAVTNMSFMFYICSSLQTVSLPNTAAVTNTNGMFQFCTSLTTVPLFNTAAVTNMAVMFDGCSSLTTVPALVTTAVTSSANLGAMFQTCSSLARIQAEDFNFTFSVASCKLSSVALNEIYTNLPTAVGQTITVSGNYGAVGDNPAIATAKGWTVTG